MGNIPLPALDVKTPAAPNIMDQYQNLLKLQDARQASQQQETLAPLQQQQQQNDTQASALILQKQQQAAKDAQATTAAMKDWDGKNYDDLAHLALTNGASGDAAMKIQQAAVQQKTAAANLALTDAKTGQAQVDAQMKKNDMLSGALSPLIDPKQVPDAQLPQAIAQTAQSLQQNGLLDPQHAQGAAQLAQMAQSNPTQARQALDSMRKGMMANSQILDEAQKRATTSKDTAQAQEATVNTQLAPQLAASKEAFQRAQLAQGQQRLGIENSKLSLQQQTAGVDPSGAPSTLAQDIASGHIPLDRMGYLLARNPGLIQGVMQVDPTFDGSKAAAYPQVYKDYTNTAPTKAGGAVLAAGTAFSHLQDLSKLNTDASHIPGTNAWTAYNNQAVTVAGELAKFYGENTDEGRASILKTLQTTLPGNRMAAITTQAHAMGERYDNYQQAWNNAAPSSKYQAPMPGYSAKAMQARAALDPEYAASQRGSGASQGPAPIIQHSPSTGQYRYSTDGGKTWQPGQPSQR